MAPQRPPHGDAAGGPVPAGQERRPGRHAVGQQRQEPLQPADIRHYFLISSPCRSCRRLRSFDLESQKIAACGSSYRFVMAAPMHSREKGVSNAQKISHDTEQDHPARRPLPGVGGGLVDGPVALPDAPKQPASGPGQQRHARRRGQGTHAGPGQSAGHASATHLHADPRIRPGIVAVPVVSEATPATGQPDPPTTAPGAEYPASSSPDRQARPARALRHFRTRRAGRRRCRFRRQAGPGQQRNRTLLPVLGAGQPRRTASGDRR
ncbi:hypothetical protein D3C76_822430 [compost metagenome]